MFGIRICQLVVCTSIGSLSLAGAAHASPVAVTFDPGVVVAGAPQFTADQLNALEYARADLTGNNFTESGYLQVNNASLNNNTFNPNGNRTTYSLYLSFNATGTQSLPNFNGASTGTVNTLSYTLYEVPGASSFAITGGEPLVTNSGTPVALASGSLISGTTSFSASPLGAGANLSATFAQELAGFIASPNEMLTLDEVLSADSDVTNILNGGQSFTINGGTGQLTLAGPLVVTPLPATLPLFASGLGALGLLGWRKKKRKLSAGA